MKRGKVFPLLILILITSQLVSAEIYIDELHSLYNIGDVVNANVTISSTVDRVEFFKAYLICSINEIETYRSIESLKAGEEKRISVIAIIDNAIVGSLTGECFIRILYGAGEARSQPFEISREVSIGIDVPNAVFNPGEIVNISGKVIKANREPLNGFAEIYAEGIDVKIPTQQPTTEISPETQQATENLADSTNESETQESNETDTQESEVLEETESQQEVPVQQVESQRPIIGSVFTEVIDGVYSTSLLIPENAPSGSYNINVRVYDKDRNDEIMNSGESSATLRVRQVIEDTALEFNLDSILPGNEFIYTPAIYDQAGNKGEGEVAITILKPDKSVFLEKLAKANEANSLFIESNFTSGFWEVKANINELESTRLFFVEELRKINYSLQNGILTIKNIGNMPFDGPIEISIGNNTKIEKVYLEVGETKALKLEAPDGEYEISVNDGQIKYPLGSTFLTGRVIGISDVEDFLFGDIGVWIWALIIVILLIVALVLLRKVTKKRFVGKIPKTVSVSPQSGQAKKITAQSLIPTTSAIASVVNRGEKQDSSIIALKIKNLSKLQNSRAINSSLSVIDKALLKAKSAGSKIYVDQDYRLIIFIPRITKTSDNDITAITLAKEIESALLSYNQTSAQKIEFGIGVHAGEMAVESQEGKTKFVSLGNTIAIAKRVAENSNQNVLLSEPIYRKTSGKVKVEKVADTGFWQVRQVIDRANYDDFLYKFMNRQKATK